MRRSRPDGYIRCASDHSAVLRPAINGSASLHQALKAGLVDLPLGIPQMAQHLDQRPFAGARTARPFTDRQFAAQGGDGGRRSGQKRQDRFPGIEPRFKGFKVHLAQASSSGPPGNRGR